MNLSIIAAFAYGILAIAGGIIGYIQARSKVSLLSGSISGLLLVLAAFLSTPGAKLGVDFSGDSYCCFGSRLCSSAG